MKHPIATTSRFLYLNLWAFFLLFSGIALAVIPLYRLGVVAVIIQVAIVLFGERGAVNIFNTWSDKKRKYNVLIERNRVEFRQDTFGEYMDAPCGRLLVKIVLRDLGLSDCYKPMRKAHNGFWACKKENFRRQNVSVYINPKYSVRTDNSEI